MVVAQSAAGDDEAGDENNEYESSDSDGVDNTADTDGHSAEIVSNSVSHLSHWAKQAALAQYCFLIDDVLGRHNTAKYFTQSGTFAHADRGSGMGKRIEKGTLAHSPPRQQD